MLFRSVIFGIGWPVIRSTAHSFRTLAFTMDSLIGIGATAAYSTGILRLAGIEIGDFTSVGAMIVAINFIGNYIKTKATGHASSAIQQLLQLAAREATRVTGDGSEELVAVEKLAPGDTVRVRPGEKIPADGRIVAGTTSIDESIVSGESVPVDKAAGSQVVGSTINQMGTIDVAVERTGNDTVLAQIIDLVEEAQASRVPVQELADRVTAVFVPVILILSALTFATWLLISGGSAVSAGLSAAIATLVIACPCALGLATPTALMVGMGYGAEHGILVRNGAAIQTARDLDVVVFDKTGTLTVGRPEVRQSVEFDSPILNPSEVTRVVEERSEHPLARAIRDHLSISTDQIPPEVTAAEVVPGKGIRATVADHGALVGSPRWLRDQEVEVSAEAEQTIQAWKEQGMTVVGTAVEGTLVALYGLADEIKSDAQKAVAALHDLGLRTAMLTGDNPVAARAIAERAGIDEVVAELRPEEKIEAIRDMQREGRTVAMVGDGINDAPALK